MPRTESLPEQFKRKVTSKKATIKDVDYIPFPTTLLNLCCTDCADKGFPIGSIVNIIGDSSTGKSIMSLGIFAEMSQYKKFKNHRFLYDDIEYGNFFDLDRMFGTNCMKRIEPATGNPEEPGSETIQHFYVNLKKAFDRKKPFLYILDSYDSLASLEDQRLAKELVKAIRKGEPPPGSYESEKVRLLNRILRDIRDDLQQHNSALVVISQVRENLDGGLFSKKYRRAGGKALKHYCNLEIWLANLKSIVEKKRVIGHYVKAKVDKNRITGKVRDCTFPVYYDYGIDDIGSCVEFMLNENAWRKKDGHIYVNGDLKSSTGLKDIDSIIQLVEDTDQEKQLRKIVQEVWEEIEEEVLLNRKPRY